MKLAPTVLPQVAKDALTKLLTGSLEETLKTEAYSAWALQTLTSADQVVAPEFIMLTISSYDFRIFVLLHSSCSGPSMRYAADALHMPLEQLTTPRYYDFMGELGNRFCGAFKRDLSHCFPHMGMSTPNRLRSESLKHLKSLSLAYDIHISAKASEEATFCASLYVSVYGTREFRLDNLPKAKEQIEGGALELF